MNKGLVSICIPVFNCDRFISIAIESILNQSYENIELIIVDNCSTDNTFDEILKFKDDKIKVFRNEKNFGIEYNWNKAILYATGEFVKLMPADDVLQKKCIEKQVNILNTYDDVVLVGSNRDIINAFGKKILTPRKKYVNKILSIDDLIDLSIKSGSNPIGEPGSILLRNSLLNNLIKFDNTYPYVIDLKFYFDYLNYGNFMILEDYLYSFRVSSSSLSVDISYKQRQDFLNFINTYLSEKLLQKKINHITNIKLKVITFIKMIGRIIIYRLTNS